MKKCPRCGYENPDNADFCLKCHYPLLFQGSSSLVVPNKKICPRCGYENPPEVMFCEKCHYPLFQVREVNLENTSQDRETKENRLDKNVYSFLLVSSIFYIASILIFSILPIYAPVLNVISTIILSFSIRYAKVKWYYYLANLSPIGLFLITLNPMVGYFVFSLSGVIISDFIRIIYTVEKEESFRVAGLILIIGYVGGLILVILYDMIIAGYLVIVMESTRKILEYKKKKDYLLSS